MVVMAVVVMVTVIMVVMMVMFVRMTMAMAMVVIVVMIMRVQRRPRQTMLLAEFLIPAGSIAIAFAGAVLQPAANAFHMMVVAFLRHAHFRLETEHLFAVFAHLAVHHAGPFEDFNQPVLECVDHQGMIVEIAGLDELDIGMTRRHLVGVAVDALHQHAGEQEIRENDDPLVAELRRMFEAGLDQRKGDAGITRLRPAETHAFPQHAHHLGNV